MISRAMPAEFRETPVAGVTMLPERERRFVLARRVAHLATADRDARPHVVPVCFALARSTLYVTIDEKPKRHAARLKRLRNVAENPAVCIVVDRYEEDWSLLGWVMLRGRARILTEEPEHDEAQALVRSRYPQLAGMQIADLPVLAVDIDTVTSWGNLSATA